MISHWRVRWAERENGRRRSASDAWAYEDADLRSMRSAAAAYTGEPASLPIPTPSGERVYLTVSAARSVEAPHIAVPPLGVPFSPPSAPTGLVPSGILAGGEGTAVVTSRRLLFFGPGFTREWPYESLTGLVDDARAPMTLMRTAAGSPSGVLIPAAAAKGFRFNLRLAVADAFGERPGMVAQIDRAISWHQQQRPVPPVPADPMLAPAWAWWSPLRASLVGALALILLLCVVGQFLPDPATTAPDTHDAAKVGTTVTSPAPNPPRITTTTASPLAPASSSAAAPALTPASSKPAVKPKPKPKPTTSPKPKPVDLCGAPQNPFGYTFCGGAHVTSPDADTCTFFSCIGAFWDGKGYMEQCDDGMVSMSGGRSGSCSSHGGNRRPVYRR